MRFIWKFDAHHLFLWPASFTFLERIKSRVFERIKVSFRREAADGAVSVVAHEKGIYDMRKGRRPELEKSPLAWYLALCGEVETALCRKDR